MLGAKRRSRCVLVLGLPAEVARPTQEDMLGPDCGGSFVYWHISYENAMMGHAERCDALDAGREEVRCSWTDLPAEIFAHSVP